jgi:hypothetical protein
VSCAFSRAPLKTGHETSNVDGVMNGEIDEFLKSLSNDDGTKEEGIFYKLLVEKYLKFMDHKKTSLSLNVLRGFSSLNKYINTYFIYNYCRIDYKK